MSSDEPRFTYDSIAAAYAAGIDSAPYNALYERPAMLSLLPPVDGARILDAGCGSGWYAEHLTAAGARVTAIDSSAAMVGYTRERLGRLGAPAGRPGSAPQAISDVFVADLAQPLDFAEDSSFDGIISPLVLHYMRDWRPTLREFRRILRPDGWLLFSTHHPGADAAIFGSNRYFDVERVEDHWKEVGKVEFYRRPLGEITASLTESGFAIERLVEPLPTNAFKEARPESYNRLLRQPEFLIVLARPWPGARS